MIGTSQHRPFAPLDRRTGLLNLVILTLTIVAIMFWLTGNDAVLAEANGKANSNLELTSPNPGGLTIGPRATEHGHAGAGQPQPFEKRKRPQSGHPRANASTPDGTRTTCAKSCEDKTRLPRPAHWQIAPNAVVRYDYFRYDLRHSFAAKKAEVPFMHHETNADPETSGATTVRTISKNDSRGRKWRHDKINQALMAIATLSVLGIVVALLQPVDKWKRSMIWHAT